MDCFNNVFTTFFALTLAMVLLN